VHVCNRCKGIFKYRAKSHKVACNRTPTPQELLKEWAQDRTATCQSLADKYCVTGPFMRDRMKLAGFSRKELNLRGHNVRSKNNEKKARSRVNRERWRPDVPKHMKICSCGVLIPGSANKCKFCRMDDSGFRTVYQMVGEAAIAAPNLVGD
jgi:hypothetical protein